MATTREFQDLLNEYLPNRLLKEELIKRDYILTKVEKDDNWKGGKIVVPFRGASASSVRFGKLTASSDIAQSKFVRGSIDSYVECWGSLLFNHTDLMQHDSGKIPEDTFLKILPDEIDEMMDYFKMVTSIQLGSGPHFATATDSTNGATGKFIVDRVDRFMLRQKCVIDDGNSVKADIYVIAIDVNTKEVTFSLTRGGAAADLSAYTTAQAAKFYHDGVTDGAGNNYTFTSFRMALLSAANGGSSTLHGVSKLAYPYLQAVNISGSSITAANILDKIFDAYTEIRTRAKGNAKTIMMSYKHLGSIMKLLQAQKGPYMVTKDASASLYGWTEIEITSVKGALTIVGIQEWDDDIIAFIDWSSLIFRSNGFFKKRKSPNGLEYYEVRTEDGYQYILDISLFGEMEWTKPGHNGIIHSISY
jgi:hypothetical protein